uniref:Uncharacterized protein n=1 Tax=Setaria viridis TaxID=4556 RepID=A0A4V6DBF2_SETVI|nr:hypothetical protein SEVIR_2G199250v2 [Setaria viridis]
MNPAACSRARDSRRTRSLEPVASMGITVLLAASVRYRTAPHRRRGHARGLETEAEET